MDLFQCLSYNPLQHCAGCGCSERPSPTTTIIITQFLVLTNDHYDKKPKASRAERPRCQKQGQQHGSILAHDCSSEGSIRFKF